jgi:endoglucanase
MIARRFDETGDGRSPLSVARHRARSRDQHSGSPHRATTRRDLLQRAAIVGLGGLLGTAAANAGDSHAAGWPALSAALLNSGPAAAQWTPPRGITLPEPSWQRLPRWRGFNLQAKFGYEKPPESFQEADFARIARLGFNFVRLPLDYRFWTQPDDWTRLREEGLSDIDRAVGLGMRYGIHVCLNFHRAPGYTVARPAEARSLWTDAEAQRVCAGHWAYFASRYLGIPNRHLSFNLLNEPDDVDPETHRRVVEYLVAAIRKYDDQRLIICDGRDGGRTPPTELVGLDVAVASRGYEPRPLTHYQAEWVNGAYDWSRPAYPLRQDDIVWDKETLRQRIMEPWARLAARGVGTMVGEFGAYKHTPHSVVLAWMRDCLELWREAGWGWAQWQFRGDFGPLDSGRTEVSYVNWDGHQVDWAMLDLLLRY